MVGKLVSGSRTTWGMGPAFPIMMLPPFGWFSEELPLVAFWWRAPVYPKSDGVQVPEHAAAPIWAGSGDVQVTGTGISPVS